MDREKRKGNIPIPENLKELLNEAQWRKYLVMIPSMNAARPEVRALLSSRLTDVYAEGYDLTGRYYTGTGPSSVVESLACERAKEVFGASFANVQSLSGAPANVAVYMALLKGGLSEFQVALAMDEQADMHAGRGQALEGLRDRRGALRAYREALRLDPANEAARHGVARLFTGPGST